jgi:hypothetical protein
MYACIYLLLYIFMYIQHAANSEESIESIEYIEREQSQEEQSQIKCCHVLIGRITNHQSAMSIQQESSPFLSMFQYIIGHEDSLDAVVGPETTCKQLRKKEESSRKRSRLPW